MFLLESPHRDDSNEYKQNTLSISKRSKRKSPEIIQTTIMSAATGFLVGTQERVRNSRGKRAISVRAIEVLLYFVVKLIYCNLP